MNPTFAEPLESAVPRAVMRAEIAAWAQRLGVEYREVHFRPMKRKWASCSSRGRLTFDTSLLVQPAALRAEVIVHELLHLRIPNHGRLFRTVLRTHLSAAGIPLPTQAGGSPKAPTSLTKQIPHSSE